MPEGHHEPKHVFDQIVMRRQQLQQVHAHAGIAWQNQACVWFPQGTDTTSKLQLMAVEQM